MLKVLKQVIPKMVNVLSLSRSVPSVVKKSQVWNESMLMILPSDVAKKDFLAIRRLLSLHAKFCVMC